MITLKLQMEPAEKIGFYKILLGEGKSLGEEEKIPIKDLGLLADSLDELQIEFYDEKENLLYQGYFDTVNTKIKKEDTADENR